MTSRNYISALDETGKQGERHPTLNSAGLSHEPIEEDEIVFEFFVADVERVELRPVAELGQRSVHEVGWEQGAGRYAVDAFLPGQKHVESTFYVSFVGTGAHMVGVLVKTLRALMNGVSKHHNISGAPVPGAANRTNTNPRVR